MVMTVNVDGQVSCVVFYECFNFNCPSTSIYRFSRLLEHLEITSRNTF